MRRVLASRATIGLALIIVVAACLGAAAARAQSSDELDTLNRQVQQLIQKGRYAEAVPLANRSLELTHRQKGRDHVDTATSMYWLGRSFELQGHYAEAEPLYKQALAIREKVRGPEHSEVAADLNNLGVLYNNQGRYGEAEIFHRRALAIREKILGPTHPDRAGSLMNLADVYRDQGRYREAEPLYKRALAIYEKSFGPVHVTTGISLGNLAGLYFRQGRYAEAEQLYKRVLGIDEKLLGREHSSFAIDLNNLGVLYNNQGRYGEAESFHRRALAIREKVLGLWHPLTAASLKNLALVYNNQGGRYSEQEALLKRALDIEEKGLGTEHPSTLISLNNLALLYYRQSRYADAEPLYKRVLTVREKMVGPDHPDVGDSLNNLAELYRAQGRYADAEPLHLRALAIRENALGPDHPNVGQSLANLAFLYFSQGDWAHAVDLWRRSTGVIIRRTQRGTLDVGQAITGKRKSEAEQLSWRFKDFIKAAYRIAPNEHDMTMGLVREMFQTAQWAQSSKAAASVAQMAARGATGDPRLATLVRERQDLVAEWQRRDADRSAAVAKVADTRDARSEAANVARQAAIDTRIADIDKRLSAGFPDYAALASPAPLSVEDVQAQLGENEALVLFIDTPEEKPTPEETFIWAITKTDSRWGRSLIGTASLTREVTTLRCGLDYKSWRIGSPCPDLLKVSYTRVDHALGKPLPFDLVRAHELSKALFGEIEDVIKDKQLLIVPSGPLTQLPFQVLVTEPPAAALPSSSAGYRNVAWLVGKRAITELPAVSSLKALREFAKDSHASEPFIGFGNPLLEGNPKDDGDVAAAKLAREIRCEPMQRQRAALLSEQHGGTRVGVRSNGGIADIADIRSWAPLPETADELCDVAQDLGVDPATHLYLGAKATETEIKRLSADGTLAHYKIVHFATHGVIAGQLSGTSEPGLILTPPDKANETDDGYLTASEVAGLKLDADWVILSACNTAAGGAEGAEALSGLARAFFYAGARSLLVSHWEVNSDSTVKLMTKAVTELQANPKIGRAEALRRSMLSMITEGKAYEGHPAVWAPFVLVGEGAR